MDIEEFLSKNPTWSVSDLMGFKCDGEYDEAALQALHDNVHREHTAPVPA